jgi:hypothetical protein
VKTQELVASLSFNEALDRVASIREGYKSCNGSLYKNVAVGVMEDFLQACIAKWGRHPFMDCVEREYARENASEEIVSSFRGDKGLRPAEEPPVLSTYQHVKKEDMSPKIIGLIREALIEAREELASAAGEDAKRHMTLCVESLEGAYLRAALRYRLNGLSLPGEDV